MRDYLFTSESVSEGHPDKVADQISDAILDAHLSLDPKSKVACETLVAKNLIVIAGEITSSKNVDYSLIAKKVISEIGYTDVSSGFNLDECKIVKSISEQSGDINQGVALGDKIGAGDQGIMFGYATNETEELMPLPIIFAHKILEELARHRKNKKVDWLRPDSKSQVTVRYEENRPISVERIVVSTQHSDSIKHSEIKDFIISEVIARVIPKNLISDKIEYFINPTGRFVEGGPQADTGLTGRKIIVDTYGGACPHGGGAFSGKDPSKVDRSAAYMARYVAKNIVAADIAKKCTIQLSYSIGVPEPLSIYLDFHRTGLIEESIVEKQLSQIFDLTPKGIIDTLDLYKPVYQSTSTYGHFGRDIFTWEKLDMVEQLKSSFNY
ncbi:MAG: methionine adenosyltransferase [Melioribacteraceae bacterium]|nr:methionine adenosyltransferase [Melioribacteraceae bacterium]